MGEHEPSLDRPQPTASNDESADAANHGPNMVLFYSLIALALIAAIGLALLIVRPFYLRR